jgi:dienelactone hydrolase
MFEYFQENYTWNMATVTAVGMGGAISEINEACRSLRDASVRNDSFAQQAWFESWKKVAERVERLAFAHEEAGQHLSAGRKYLRASIYYLMAERMLPSRDHRKIQTYREGLAAFKKGVQFRNELVEWVEVPFQGKFLPALFSKVPGKGRSPCMVHFDGFDWLKEFNYLTSAEEFRRRGISLLIVDHPGVGEALRLRNMYSGIDTEAPAAACVDYLETRSDVDSSRIGIMALSLGGYYAPRAAAFEKRFKCCIAWGAIWDWEERLSKRLAGKGGEVSLPDFWEQFKWVFGKDTVEEAATIGKQFTLEEVAGKITCPLLVVHGENDRQVPLWHAEKTIEATVNSPIRKLKVLTLAEGGAEHCQVDNAAMAVDYMADWAAEILGGNPKGL